VENSLWKRVRPVYDRLSGGGGGGGGDDDDD